MVKRGENWDVGNGLHLGEQDLTNLGQVLTVGDIQAALERVVNSDGAALARQYDATSTGVTEELRLVTGQLDG